MTYGEFKAKLVGGWKGRFFYQQLPGFGTYDPVIGTQPPAHSSYEFALRANIQGWDEEEYIGVVHTAKSVSLVATTDPAHKDDVISVIPGSVFVIVGSV